MAKMTDNKTIHLKDIVKRVIDIVVYEDIKDAHFLNFLECPDDVEDIEDSEEVIYLDMSDEQLKQFTPEQVHKFTNIELLDKINNVYKEALNEKQIQTLINLNKQQFTITKEDVQVLLDKLKLCKTIKVERRTKNNTFYNQYNITDSDALNIIHQLKVEDYCANTKSVNLKHLNNNLMIFEPTVEIHKFKVSLVLYIKLDVDETTGDTVVLVSIHEATTQDPLPYLKGNKNTLVSSKNCNINMKGEFLMEDNKTTIKSNGIYSVLNNKWIKEPTKESIPSIDEEELAKELKPWEDRYLALVNKIKEEPIKMTEATLNEFTTSRVYKYITEGNFVMMSAYKSDLSTKENKANQQELMDSIRKLGLGYVQFNSAYVINRDSKDSLVSKEEGLLIPNMKKEDAFKLAEKYRQDTIIYGSEGKVQELCTTPFEGHNKGDIVTTYNVSDKDKTLNIESEKKFFYKGISWCAICDGPLYKNQDVCVVGGGMSAISSCLTLSKFARKVYLVHRRNSFKNESSDLELLKKKDNVEILLNSEIIEFKGINELEEIVISRKTGLEESIITLSVKCVFECVGKVPNTAIFKGLIDLNSDGYIITDEQMKTNVKGIFACGDVRVKDVRQIATAISDGAISAVTANKYLK